LNEEAGVFAVVVLGHQVHRDDLTFGHKIGSIERTGGETFEVQS